MIAPLKSTSRARTAFYFFLMTAMLLPFAFGGPPATAQSPDTVNAKNVTTAPTIDGALNEADWSLTTSVAKTTIGSPNNTTTFGVLWNSTHLYVGVRVLDANLFNDSANIWEDDSVEVYIDANHNHGTVYDSFDRQFTKGYNDGALGGAGSQTGVVHAWTAISGGYSVELAIPWSNLGVTPTSGLTIGFDVGYNDDDNGGTRDSQAVWWGNINNYNNTSAFGHAFLQAAGPTATPTFTNTPPPPTNTFTNTPSGPTSTPTNTPIATNTPTNTLPSTNTPTRTNTPSGPTNTPTNTPIPLTNTPTNTPVSGQAPFGGTAWAIPGTIQAENYDTGGEGVAYHDLETANQGGQYRTTEGVDIETTTDTGGGYNVGWIRTNEWLEYTVNVATAGSYTLVARVASGVGTGTFHVEFDGIDKTGIVAVASTGGWQTWANLSRTVSLSAGQQVMRIYFNNLEFNLNYLTFTSGATATPTNTPVGPTPTPTNTSGANQPPNTPTITEPNIPGKIVNPADVHMETGPFSDPNPGQAHACTDWEIWNSTVTERVWLTSCIGGLEKVHTHLGDGVFQGSHVGRTDLLPNTNYVLRVRHKDNSGQPATEWSAFAQRGFVTSSVSIGDPDNLWTFQQPGYEVQVVATGLQLPVNIAFIPNAGTQPNSPLYYVTELYGIIKVVTRDGTMLNYATGLLNFNPTGNFPGTGEQGLTGIVVEPATKDVFVGLLYEAAGGAHYPKVVRFHSNDGGLTMATQTTILDMVGEPQGQSHQISNLSLGPDGKLYVHMGDGFDASMAQNLSSFRGKILRVNLDGTAPTDNPLYNAGDGINARDYAYAYGFRNPFGGAWRAADNAHYEVENGPSRDRFAKVVANRNYLWDGTDASMNNFALYVWNPSRAPVNAAFVQTQTFGGSGFPANKMDHVYVSESGPTYATGPQTLGKRSVEFVLDASGNLVSGPTTLIEYTGVGKSTVVALAAGPDGLYFSDLYKDQNYVSPIDRGANILRVQFVGVVDFSAAPTSGAAPLNVQFTNLSTVPSPTSWLWEFGDGTTSTQQSPSHSYTATGSYNVRLTVTGASGSRSTLKSGFITVNP